MSTVDAPVSELREQLEAAERHEFRLALRTLLMRPLLPATDDAFPAVRRQATALRDWLASETGWILHVDRSHARLRKTPARLTDGTRGARARPGDPPFSRRRYVLLCLALAALEGEERQTALGRLAERIVGSVAADEQLAAAGVRFTLETRDERRDLVAVARLLLALKVLRRVDGDEAAYVTGAGDALYAVDRAALAAMLATRRPPTTVDAVHLDDRLAAITEEPVPDTTDARNRAIRHRLTRRLLDDAVLAYDELDDAELAYLTSQRARILGAITEATGLVPEIRAEGIALLDDRGDATDLRIPEEGTDGHLTLLLAEHLARALRARPGTPVPFHELEAHTAELAVRHAAHWRKDATDPANGPTLTADAVGRLAALDLVVVTDAGVLPRPPIARYAVDEPLLPPSLQLFDQDAP
ncbi:TIGR02678 family protein [Egicoccus halophilus]|uniref:TIGR02678 family protein n=1 Tax=Egicoccus halophilus TaxID=1670830 RepID=A0A8J3ABA2_9ACTN|nr:TIGR02678 family protein [Egicoccus halophilus]GGI09393.1 hypothetical protein GCM10011354_33850 [Egicoccus halophilus]